MDNVYYIGSGYLTVLISADEGVKPITIDTEDCISVLIVISVRSIHHHFRQRYTRE